MNQFSEPIKSTPNTTTSWKLYILPNTRPWPSSRTQPILVRFGSSLSARSEARLKYPRFIRLALQAVWMLLHQSPVTFTIAKLMLIVSYPKTKRIPGQHYKLIVSLIPPYIPKNMKPQMLMIANHLKNKHRNH